MNERLLNVFKTVFALSSVDETVSKRSCSEWDSMNHLNLIIALEDEFNLSLEPDEINQMNDFDSVKRILETRMKASQN